MFNAVREPYAGKLARTVLRGPRFREESRLPSNLARETDGDFFNNIEIEETFEPTRRRTGS
jgi:hypothetical protein